MAKSAFSMDCDLIVALKDAIERADSRLRSIDKDNYVTAMGLDDLIVTLRNAVDEITNDLEARGAITTTPLHSVFCPCCHERGGW